MFKTWLPAISGMICLGLGAGLIGVYGFFVPLLSEEFGASTAALNTGPVLLLLVPAFVAPFVGKLADRLPIRRLLLTGVTLAMLSLLAGSQAPTLPLVALGFLGFSLGLTLYGPVVVNGLMVKIYPGREARALAVVAIGISVATAVVPLAVGWLLTFLDWRQALACLALGVLACVWFAVLTGIPGGVAGEAGEKPERAGKEIYRRAEFWLIGGCMALGMNVAMVQAVCYPPLFISKGFSPVEAGSFLTMAGVAGLLGKAGIAWLGDAGRQYAKWLVAGLLSSQAFAMFLLRSADNSAEVIGVLLIAGFSGGAFLPMHAYLNSRYFSPAVIGQVTGSQMPLFLPFGLVGAPLAGYVFDSTGSYDLVLLGLVVALLCAAALAVRLSGKASDGSPALQAD